MSKVTVYYPKTKKNEVRAQDIRVGIYFTGRIGMHSGLFVRAYDSIVYLANPVNTWSTDVLIEDFQQVDVEITAKA